MSRRLADAGAIAAVLASVAYVVACAYDLAVAGRGDPYLIVRDVHFGYYHRVALAAWIGGLGGGIAYLHLDRPERLERLERWIGTAVVPLVFVLAIGTYFMP